MVLRTLTCPARNHEHIVAACGILESAAYAIRIVREHPKNCRFGAHGLDQTVQHWCVGVIDLTLLENVSRAQDLVTSRKDGDPKRCMAGKPIDTAGCGGRHVFRSEPHTRLHQDGTLFGILAGKPAIDTLFQANGHSCKPLPLLLLDADKFLHGDGIMPAWHYRAGEDAHRAVARRRFREGMPRSGFTYDLEACALDFIITGMGEGIAVDRGVVVGRDGPRSKDGFGKIAPRGIVQGDLFHLNDRPHSGLQDGKCLAMRKPILVEDEAIISELVGHRGVRLRCRVMKSEIPRISSRWKIGRDSVSSPGRSEATATISGTPVSGCREELPSLRSSIFGNGSRLKPSTKIKSQLPAS